MQKKSSDGEENKAFDASNVSLNIPPSDVYNNNSKTCIVQAAADDENELEINKESCYSCGNWCQNLCANIFRKKTLYKRLPILTWLPQYQTEDFVGDLVAGITVGLTIIPQGLAYAGVAGLDLQYGLYGCFFGCFIYIFLGSSKDVPVGPTAISALLTFQAAQGVWQLAVLLTFLTGIIEILMGVFRLGFLVDFVSGPVNAGFISAASLIIFTSQLKDILGVNTKGATFLEMWISIIKDIHNISWNDFALGIGCIVVLLLMRAMASASFGPKEGKNCWQKFATNFCWLIGTARNAVLVICVALMGYILLSQNIDIFRMVGYVPKGLPDFKLPPFSMDLEQYNDNGDVTGIEHFNLMDMLNILGSSLIVVPLIALLENMAVVQTFANGKASDANQELLAVGFCNVFNSFMQGFRGNGALARGAVLNASGNRSQLSNLYTGLLVIIALLFLTPAFFYIPKAALAAIIVAAVVFMIQYRVVKPMWRSKKTDLIPGLATFIACLLLPLQIGILVGIGINVIFILYHAARPKMRIETLTTHSTDIRYLMLTPDRCLIFPSVEFVRNVINKQGRKSATLPVIIDCTHIYGADFTAAKVVSTLVKDFQARGQHLYFYNLQPRVAQVFEGLSKDLVVLYDMASLEVTLSKKEIPNAF